LARDLLFTSSVQKKIDTYKAGPSIKYSINRKFSTFVIPVLILFFLLSTSYAEIYKVKRVIDGDTLLLINGERVRLIDFHLSIWRSSEDMRERRGIRGRGCGDKMIRSESWGYLKLPGILLETREEIWGSDICNKVFFSPTKHH